MCPEHSAQGVGTAHIADSAALERILDVWLAEKGPPAFVDTAITYGTEAMIGEYIAAHPGSRQRMFLGSKINAANQALGVRQALERSLSLLRVRTIDLYSIHSPKYPNFEETWMEMETLRAEGLLRRAGVSNFGVEELRRLEGMPQVYANQIPLTPGDRRGLELAAYCRARGIEVHACMPFRCLRDGRARAVAWVAARRGGTLQQVVLSWLLSHGAAPVFGTSSAAHLLENLRTLSLTAEDIAFLDGIKA